MLQLAVVLLLASGSADCTLAKDAVTLSNSTATVTSAVTSAAPHVTGFAKPIAWKQGQKNGQGNGQGNGLGNSQTNGNANGLGGNRPTPGPLPLALLALGASGVAGAMFASRRRRKAAHVELPGKQ